MKLEFDNNRPIYIQLVEYIKIKIISGDIEPGSRLDSVRNMAEEVEVNPNTMQRALAELEREGLVFSQRTRGRFVTEDEMKIREMRKEFARIEIAKLQEILTSLGYKNEEIKDIIIENLKEGN
ncbi:MAG: GntR family transcriptional regulator [Clostridioides sp.]|jgi:DNA-binding transcriptional regulator YhcF (GntR family)|nr:GntR family transcriptional regulator [Clostridioides sp.]